DLGGLCHTIAAGEDVETVESVRDYERDPNGQIVGHSDYTLDGLPYEPQGEVGQCQSGGECCEPPEPVPSLDIRCETFVLCDTGNPDVGDEPVSFMRAVCRDSTGNVVSVTDTELDAVTPYTVRS